MHDDCTSQPTQGSFGRKYADCLPTFHDDTPLYPDESTDEEDFGGRRPDWLDEEEEGPPSQGGGENGFPDYMQNPWDASTTYNASDFLPSDWDETANFTGMDEYWAGMRRFDEGEEVPWWMESQRNGNDEGENYNNYDDGPDWWGYDEGKLSISTHLLVPTCTM